VFALGGARALQNSNTSSPLASDKILQSDLTSFTSYATTALNALMDNWYQFGSGTWRGLGWWNSANALETVINYSFNAPLDNIDSIIWDVYNNGTTKDKGSFLNYYYDDEGWWALALLRAYDRTGSSEFLATAEMIFDDIQGGWDEEVCTGGLWWSKAKTDKNAIENELFITLATRLYSATGKGKYLTWAKRTWNWFSGTGMQGSSGLINDGVDLTTCGSNHKTAWTYNQGVILGGLSGLYQITGDMAYLSKAREIATSAMNLLVDDQGILTEPCESSPSGCGQDGTQFKGIFVRYLSYLYNLEMQIPQQGLGEVEERENLQFLSDCKSFLIRQATSIWNNDRDDSNTLGVHWAGPYSEANASTQSSALDALVAVMSV
jgi:predicted alpha-1,6-mannanase (GH76 family)